MRMVISFRNESAAVSGVFHTCEISEHLIESQHVGQDGRRKPRIHSVSNIHGQVVINAGDAWPQGYMRP